MPTHNLMSVQAELHPDNIGPVSCSQKILRHNYQIYILIGDQLHNNNKS